ncbi:hypothetical protein RRG08_011211 [Elysia crispata]|uniref:Uncharacterized protein n=1 Tax=Elysia crispata TaxID=231223 RepID=A0AAE0Z4E2_9GAST|nr:hypothetical protein RRG08_026400 [Elysia crispata]KAK3784388.1 hypothetical protein RRG08_011211 [Elysia crispata]
MLEEDQGLRPDVPDLSDKHGRLRLRANTDVNLINENTGRPNKLTTIASHKGGRDLVRKHLGFSKWTPEMSKAAEAALLKYNQELGEATESLDTGGATEAYPRERRRERPRLLPRLRPRSCERSRFC